MKIGIVTCNLHSKILTIPLNSLYSGPQYDALYNPPQGVQTIAHVKPLTVHQVPEYMHSSPRPARRSVRGLQRIPTLRVQVPNIEVLGIWGIVTVVQVLGGYMIIGYLDL